MLHAERKAGNGPGDKARVSLLKMDLYTAFWPDSSFICLCMCLFVFLTGANVNVRKVLRILDVLDSHTFYSCRAHNPLTTLYCSLSAAQCSFEAPLNDEMLTMLLCQWAVTPYRSGEHRPLVVAMLLRQRQDDIMKVNVVWSDFFF